MEIKYINIGGSREEINKITKEHQPNLLEIIKPNDLIFSPEKLIKKFFKGTEEEYHHWLIHHKLHPSQINYHLINQKSELIKKLKVYTMRLLDESKKDSLFFNELGNISVTKWLESFDTLENHIYDLSDFSKIEFLKIFDHFKTKFTTNSPFAFLIIDELNQHIIIVESHKVLLRLNKPLPIGNKKGTPSGKAPEKLYQNFFTSIGYKGKGELTEGLNYHRTSFKNFNFNLNIETRLLNDIIYQELFYNPKETQIAFMFGSYTKKLYFSSDLKGTERTEEEIEALEISLERTKEIEKKLHKRRQGSIKADKTSTEVKKRIDYPKQTINISNEKYKKSNTKQIPSTSLEQLNQEIKKRQQGYSELAKKKIRDAFSHSDQYVQEFYNFLDKGMTISDALSKFSERYANNPYIKGIIETSITGELQLHALKNKGIEELTSSITLLEDQLQQIKDEIGYKEDEITSLNQKLESIIINHTKQLEKIEFNIHELILEKEQLLKEKHQQSEMIIELENLLTQYESTLQKQEEEAIHYKEKLILLEEENNLLSNHLKSSNLELEHYLQKITQLQEENRLLLSNSNLLKSNNQQLHSQIDFLTSEIKLLTKQRK